MIPVLYEANEKNFTTNGVGLLVDAVSCIVTEERNGAFELVLVYPQNGQLAQHITEESIIKAKPNDTDEDQLFRIYKSGKPIAGNDTWHAEHVSYELNTNPVCRPEITAKNAQEAIEQLLTEAEIESDYTVYSDITTRNSTQINEVVSVRKALGGVEGSILDTWGGEFKFNNFRIELHEARGSDNGVEIRYGKNMLDAQMEKNISEVVTAIFPHALYTPETEGEEDPEEVLVTLPERIIKTPNVDKYARVRCVPVDFSDSFEDGEAITEGKLREVAEAYAKSGIDEPKIHITASFINLWKTKEYANIKALEKIGLCDTVTVVIERLNISEKAKVTKYSYNTLKERFESVEIGEVKPNLTREITKQQEETKEKIVRTATRSEQIKQQIEKTIRDVTAAITGNSGGYVVLYPEKNPQEIFILDTPDINTAQNVWRWNLAGLGHSSNGVGGPFKTAITADGKIVADFVATGELNGLLIKAGTVTAETIDAEYKESVIKYTDDGDKVLKEDYTSKFKTTAESITAEVSRATTAEGELRAAIKVNADSIKLKVSQGNISSEISQEAGKIEIKSNRFSLSSTNCTISADGTIKATNCDLSGKITASSGTIGGFTIGTSSIYNGKSSLSASDSGIYIGTDGIAIGKYSSGPAFKITKDGEVSIKSNGSIEFGESYQSYTIINKDKIQIYNTYIDKDTVHCAKYASAYTYYTDINGDTIQLHGSSSSGYLQIKSNETVWASYSGTYNIKGDGGEVLMNLSRNAIGVLASSVKIGTSSSYLAFFGASSGAKKTTVSKITSTTSATASTIATKLNDLIGALQGYGLIG